jgi:hypothetical protein
MAQLAAEIVASPIFYLVAGLVAIKLVSSTGEQAGSILVFAALPITALTALSKSSLGKQVRGGGQEHSVQQTWLLLGSVSMCASALVLVCTWKALFSLLFVSPRMWLVINCGQVCAACLSSRLLPSWRRSFQS